MSRSRTSRAPRTVVTGGSVLVGPPAHGRVERADLVIEDGVIARLSPVPGTSATLAAARDKARTAGPGTEVVDATGCFVLPGFVDTHHHLWQTTMRGLTADWDLGDILWGIRVHHAALHQPEDVYAGTYAGALAALDAGITTVLDFAHAVHTPDHADEAVRAVQDAGIRAVWCYGLHDAPAARRSFSRPQQRWQDVRRVRDRLLPGDAAGDPGRGGGALVTLGVAANDIGTLPWEITRGEFALARELDVLLTLHTNSVWLPGRAPEIAWLHRDGLLGPRQLHAHATTSSDTELRLLADSGSALASTVETELQTGMGQPVFARAAALGVPVGLGADSQSNNSADPFTQMRLAMQAENGRGNQPVLESAGVTGLKGVPVGVREILHHATLGGARTLGLDHLTGSLEPGKAADLVLLRHDRLHHRPVVDPLATIVLHSRASDVHGVFVGGRHVKRDGVLDHVDTGRAAALADRAFARISAELSQRGGRKPPRPAGLMEKARSEAARNAPEWSGRHSR